MAWDALGSGQSLCTLYQEARAGPARPDYGKKGAGAEAETDPHATVGCIPVTRLSLLAAATLGKGPLKHCAWPPCQSFHPPRAPLG